MYPHQDDHAIPRPPYSEDPPYNSYPVVVASPSLEAAPPSSLDDNYYPSHYQQSYTDALAQPCIQQFAPQLHIQTDITSRYQDLLSPYASASTSTSYPPPTPPSPGPQSALLEYPEHACAPSNCQTTTRGPQLPYRVTQSDQPASSLWYQSESSQHPYQPSGYQRPDSSPQCSPAYNAPRPPSPYTSPALTYYNDHGVQLHSANEQLVSNMYSDQVPYYHHTQQYTGSPVSQIPYPHDEHHGALVSQMMDENPTLLSHGSESFHHPSQIRLGTEHAPTVNVQLRHHAPFIHGAQLPSEPIFDSPLREPLRDSIEELPETSAYHYPSSLPDPDVLHNIRVGSSFQEHPVLHSEERHIVPHSLVESHPPSQLSPRVHSPRLPHSNIEFPFHGAARRSPAEEATRGPIQGPIQPPQLLQADSIQRLAGPSMDSRTPSATSSDPGLNRHRRSPSQEQLLQAPIVPSQSHLVTRRERGNRTIRTQLHGFRPFHPYRPEEHGEGSSAHGHYPEATLVGGSRRRSGSPTPVFGLFGSYPLSRGPREQPLPGPTCAPESSSSVMRLTLTPPFKRPPPPPPVPPVVAARRPRMACFFCRKRKIACGPGPSAHPRSTEEGKRGDEKEEEPPCNQCARRGLQCGRPTESKRGVRRGKGRGKEGGEAVTESATASGSQVTLELAPRPRPNGPAAGPSKEDSGSGDQDDVNGDDTP